MRASRGRIGMDSKFKGAFENLMFLEGGRVTDHAGATNYGVTLRNLIASGDMDFDLDHDGDLDKQDLWAFSKDDARVYVYRHWWIPLGLERVVSGVVASKMLDIIFNCGVPRGVRIVQQACNRFTEGLLVDGKLGPKTLRSVNRIPPMSLLEELRAGQGEWYGYLIERDPGTYLKYRDGWMARART